MRGARKPKKEKEVLEVAEHDAFQEQGGKFFETLTEHPWFVGGTVLAIIVITIISLGIASILRSSEGVDADIFAEGVKVWEEIQTSPKEDVVKRNELLESAIKKFSFSAKELSGTVEGDSSLLYIGKAYYLLNKCSEAVISFKKAQSASNLPKELRFGAYEGEAFCAYDNGKFNDAIAVWEKYLNATKGDFYKDYALFYIGTAYEKAGNKAKSIEYFTKLKNSYPESMLNAKILSKLPQEQAPKVPKIIKQAS